MNLLDEMCFSSRFSEEIRNTCSAVAIADQNEEPHLPPSCSYILLDVVFWGHPCRLSPGEVHLRVAIYCVCDAHAT